MTVLCVGTAVSFGPVWAQARCRISPPHFLAERCKKRVNQASFVLLCFVVCFFWVVSRYYIFNPFTAGTHYTGFRAKFGRAPEHSLLVITNLLTAGAQ